jgi:hypothetical protein
MQDCNAASDKWWHHFQVHAILTDKKGKNQELKATVVPKTDRLTHVYTFVLHPNNTYQVRSQSSHTITRTQCMMHDVQALPGSMPLTWLCALAGADRWRPGPQRQPVRGLRVPGPQDDQGWQPMPMHTPLRTVKFSGEPLCAVRSIEVSFCTNSEQGQT